MYLYPVYLFTFQISQQSIMQICTACCQQSKTPSSWWPPSHNSSQSKHKSIIEDLSSFRLYEKRILSNHSVFLFVLKPGSDGFYTSVHKGSTWSREYVELFTFRAFYMLFKFFSDVTNLTVTAKVLHIVWEHLWCAMYHCCRQYQF